MVFLPRELEATHSAPVRSSSGVTRTLRTLRTLWGSWSRSCAYEDGGAGQGSGARAGVPERGPRRLLTVPSTLQEMVGRGCPEASQDRFSSAFSRTHIFLSFSVIHGGPSGGRSAVWQRAPRPASPPPPERPGQQVAFCPPRARNHPAPGSFKGPPALRPEGLSPKMATWTSRVRFRPGTLGTDATQR